MDELLKLAIGTFLPALGSFGAVYLALFVSKSAIAEAVRLAGEKEIEKLKADLSLTTHLRAAAEEKRATVASEILTGALQFLDGLRFISSPAPIVKGTEREDVTFRLNTMVASYDADFSKALTLAQVHMPDDVCALLEETWKLRAAILSNQQTWATQLANGDKDPQFFEKGFGSKPLAALDEFRAKLRAKLRPLARLLPVTTTELARADGTQIAKG